MSWFGEQIKQRKEYDQQILERSFVQAAESVYGHTAAKEILDERVITELAIDEILKYFGCEPVEIPETLVSLDEQLDYCLRRYGIMRRAVSLEKGWYKDAFGVLLAFSKEKDKPVVLIPDGTFGRNYCYNDHSSGEIRINRKTAEQFETEAYCFYKPLPQKKLRSADLLRYINDCSPLSDKRHFIAGVVFMTLIGMLIPQIIRMLTETTAYAGNTKMLVSIGICLLCTVFSKDLIATVNDSVIRKIRTKTVLNVQSAMMMRLLSLPARFFRSFNTGELASLSASIDELCDLLITTVVGSGVTAAAGLLYLFQLFCISGILIKPAVIIILVTVGFGVFSAYFQSKYLRRQMELSANEAGVRYGMINGVQKIKLTGAEKRFFARWLGEYTKSRTPAFSPPMMIRINTVITLAISLFSNILLYYKAAEPGFIRQSEYLSFIAAFGMLMGSLGELSNMALSLGNIKPLLEIADGFLGNEPETSDNKQFVTNISGAIELNNVYFRYDVNSPYLLYNLSLKIKAGEYVAIVGRTGCGKSTLMKLLLGFETPERGAIYYGHSENDLSTLDLSSLRRKIGTVMQDGELFQGDIFQNISISAPQITLDEAWEAAETAGIADDIRAMPMGMQTLVSAGQGGISGGQKQRILIARAIAGKPKILMFDEATSALDNKTQKQVSDALDRMGCTRIVIAHRLSTIRNCDRILVLDGGRIIEDGTYDQLIELGGFFAELVKRQRTDE